MYRPVEQCKIMLRKLSISLPWQLMIYNIISYISGEETITTNTKPCNEICHYVDWAQDANCQRCNLTTIPEECCQAVTLDLGYNNINSIPSAAFKSFQNLFHVNLEGNGLTEINPEAFEGNKETRYIYLYGNLLETIKNRTFAGTPHLLQLYLDRNKIHQVDDGAFSGLLVLETLFLSENNLTQISRFVDTLTNLRYLHMSHNRLTSLQNSTFRNLENLRYLDLIHNKIVTVDAYAFTGLVSLRVLKLAYNRITTIGQHAFLHMRHLIHVNLYNNSISSISNFTFGIEKLEEFYLGLNNLTCDCQVNTLRHWLLEHNDTDCANDTVCGLPAFFQGKPVATLTDIPCTSNSTSGSTSDPNQTWSEITTTTDANLSEKDDENGSKLTLVIIVTCVSISLVLIITMTVIWRRHLLLLLKNNLIQTKPRPESSPATPV